MISFRELSLDDAEKTLLWRKKKRITENMLTDVTHDVAQQKAWIASSYKKSHYYHWIICAGGVDAGLINICSYREESGETEFGFYIGEDEYTTVGGLVLPFFYNFLFFTLEVKKIIIEVFQSNTQALALHRFFGCTYFAEKDKEVVKNGEKKMLLSLELSRADWLGKVRFHSKNTVLPVSLWEARPRMLL